MIRNEEGQSLVEWALILPVFLMLFIGIIDFGWAFGKQHTINQMARELARSASLGMEVDDLKDEAFELSKALINANEIEQEEKGNKTIFTIKDTNGKEVVITFDDSLIKRKKGKKFKVKIQYVYEPFTPIVNSADIPLAAEYFTKSEASSKD